jgi:hypothetical protein
MNDAYTIGIFRSGYNPDGSPGVSLWAVDSNGSHAWEPNDASYYFGLAGDIPVMGDWTFTGQRRMGIFRNGYWYVDVDGNGAWDQPPDSVLAFGLPGDLPLTIGLSDGYLHLAVFRPNPGTPSIGGTLYVDTSTCNCYKKTTTAVYSIYNTQSVYSNTQSVWNALSGDLPMMINADGLGSRLAFFRPSSGSWYVGPLTSSGNLSFDLNYAPVYQYGVYGDLPVAGDWTGSNSAVWNIGVYRGQAFGMWTQTVTTSGSHPMRYSTLLEYQATFR